MSWPVAQEGVEDLDICAREIRLGMAGTQQVVRRAYCISRCVRPELGHRITMWQIGTLGGCKAGVIRHGVEKLIHPEHTDNVIEGFNLQIAQDFCGTGRNNLAEA